MCGCSGTQRGERRFARLKETNDHEGETWYWYLQLEGNAERLQDLANLIAKHDPAGNEFELDTVNTLSEGEVDTLVGHGNDTVMYQQQFNKITGVMQSVVEDDLVHRYGAYDGQPGWLELDGLYKGGVRSLFIN